MGAAECVGSSVGAPPPVASRRRLRAMGHARIGAVEARIQRESVGSNVPLESFAAHHLEDIGSVGFGESGRVHPGGTTAEAIGGRSWYGCRNHDVRSIQSWVAGFTNVVTAVTTRDDNIALLVKLCAIRFWL